MFSGLGARSASLSALLALVLAPLALVASPAQAAVTDLVINEVYGGGGNADAPFTNDYVELYNPTNQPVNLTGTSLQYRSATNTGTGLTILSGTVEAGGYFLVQQGSGGSNGVPLPSPDASGSLNMSATNGTVFLAGTTSLVTLTRAPPPEMPRSSTSSAGAPRTPSRGPPPRR